MTGARIGFLELTGSAGCLATLYYSRKASEFLRKSEITYWPSQGIMGDYSAGLDVGFVAGLVRTKRDLERLKGFREKTRILVAFGTTAIYGGLIGMTALVDPSKDKEYSKLEEEYKTLLPTVKPVTSYVEPDILVPGQPPTQGLIEKMIDEILIRLEKDVEGKAVFLQEPNNLCKNCPRKPKDPSRIEMPGIKNLGEIDLSQTDKCFLELGVLCMGPVTAGGCGHICIRQGQPCTGCMGPASGVVDQGLSYISSIASIFEKSRERQVMFDYFAKELDRLKDPLGHLYRYTLPKAMLTQLALRRRGVE